MAGESPTTHYNLLKPIVGGNATTWGGTLNDDLDKIDAAIFTHAGALTSNTLALSSNPGTAISASLIFANGSAATGQQARWAWIEDVSAEVGSDSGSNLSLVAYHDGGGGVSTTPIAINRANGAITLGTPINSTSTAAFASLSATGTATFATLNATSINVTTLTGTTITSNALTSNTTLNVGGGAQINGGLTIYSGLNVASGGAVFAGGIAGATSFNSNISVAGQGSFGTVSVGGNINAANFVLPAGGALAGPSGGSLIYDGASWLLANGSGGNFLVQNNSAFKPGGGVWGTLSDARIKTVTGEYEPGLEEVLRLRPVTYRYKSNGDKEHVGLVAQELEEIFPTMVSKQEGVIDGVTVSDLRAVDASELIYALVNCVKQLKAEIEALKR